MSMHLSVYVGPYIELSFDLREHLSDDVRENLYDYLFESPQDSQLLIPNRKFINRKTTFGWNNDDEMEVPISNTDRDDEMREFEKFFGNQLEPLFKAGLFLIKWGVVTYYN